MEHFFFPCDFYYYANERTMNLESVKLATNIEPELA